MSDRRSAAKERAALVMEALRASTTLKEAESRIGLSAAAMRAILNRLELAAPTDFLGLGPMNDVEPSLASESSDGLETIAFCPDAHHPYVDEGAWALFLSCLRVLKPSRLIVLGDFGDFYATSRHPKDPRRSADLAWEVDKSNEALDQLDELPIAHKHFIFGNHEDNLRRHLQDCSPALFNVVKVEELFRLPQRGWTWSQYGDLYKLGKLYVTHDQDFAGNRAHEQTRDGIGHNTVIGHTHHMAISYRRNIVGESHVGAMFGWLGSEDAAEYMKKSKKRNWQHGFGIGLMEPSGVVHLQAVPFISGKAVIHGRLVAA